MKLGITMFATDYAMRPDDLAQACEERGFESVWFPEHTHIPASLRTPPPVGTKVPRYLYLLHDLFVTLTAAAAVTKTIKLGTSVVIIPYRDPLVTAKIVSSLDVLSGGRFIFGVGVGWLDEEFRVLRQNLRDRAAQTREALLAMQACWTQDDPEFHGKFFDFSGIKFAPKPRQKPHPPIWFGGNSMPALKRAVELGNGWHAVWQTPEEVAEKTAILRDLCAKAGKNFANFAITINVNNRVPLTVENVKKYEAVGVSMMFIPRSFQADVDTMIENMEKFAKEVKEPAERQ